MRRTKPAPLRPFLCDRVHAALVRAGRPVTRSELNFLYLDGHNVCKTADVQAAWTRWSPRGWSFRARVGRCGAGRGAAWSTGWWGRIKRDG
jgi:hypothetical protein